LGIDLIRVMLYGPAVGIHTIIASGISYRNLLQQLVNTHPMIKEELQKKYGDPEPKQLNMIGHELIFTSDDLIFYKEPGQMEHLRLFKSSI
jgi:hypothetical protein